MKPLNKENILSFYLPVNSLISYTALSVNIMNPALRTKLDLNGASVNIKL